MKIVAAIASLVLGSALWAQTSQATGGRESTYMQTNDIRAVAPALDKYAQGPMAELWKRSGLKPRDRSIVTVSALITRNLTGELARQMNLALDNGVKPRELSEIITHLAFYSGWANGMSAVAVAKDVFACDGSRRGEVPDRGRYLRPGLEGGSE